MATSENSKKSDKELIERSIERFRLAEEAEQDIRTQALDDLKFRAGEQWPQGIKAEREQDKRPCLTVNRLPQFVRQVTNDQRQNRPSIKVFPVDDKADADTAKIFQGLIKHIEYNSNADVAYDTSFDGAVTGGRGFFRIITDYVSPESFEQELLIKRIRNPFSVYFDPNSQEPDGSDAEDCHVVEDLSKDELKRQYPNCEMASLDDWDSTGTSPPGWATKDTARIAEYLYKEYEDKTLCLMSDKSVVDKNELPKELPEGLTVIAERKTQIPVVKWCKHNGVEILERTTFPAPWIPIIPTYGDELFVDGKRILEGIIRHAKDPQRMLNYWVSSETETIALAPRAPWIGAAGQFEGFENQWKTANTRNHSYLQYKPKDLNGQPLGPPIRNVFEAPVQAITQARMQASEDLKATTGMPDASFGNRSNETSGRAIDRRAAQAQTSNFHFADNLSRSIKHAGRILVWAIPKVYDTARAARIIGEDGEQQIVRINEIFEKGGEQKVYDLSAGKYDVVVEAGPTYATKRQEAAETMLEFTKALPNAAPLIMDLIARNMDWPGAKEMAERLKKSLPPGIAEPDDKEQKPIPPEVEQKMAQMSQMVEQLTQALHSSQDKLDQKTLELESKERIEFAKLQVNAEIELAKLGSKESQVLLLQEIGQISKRLDLLHVNQPIESEQQPIGGLSPSQPME